MKKDFEQIRLEMYNIIYSFQKDLDAGSDISQTDLLDMFVDSIAGIYDMLQYYFDKAVKLVNPAVVLYSEHGYFNTFKSFLRLFKYKELNNYEKAFIPISELRANLIGTELEDGINASHSEYLSNILSEITLNNFDRNQLIRALAESWLMVLQQLDYYYGRVVDEISIDGNSAGNASGFAELFGFPLYQDPPFSANVILHKKSTLKLPEGADLTLSEENWVTTEPITFNGYKDIAFSEQVISIRDDKKAIIVKRTCTNKVGDLLLLVGKGWQRYAIITNIIKTYLYAEYEIEYAGKFDTDPEYCIKVTTLEQREKVNTVIESNGFNNQLIKLKNIAFLPDKGIKNKLLEIKVNGQELDFVYHPDKIGKGNYTYRVGKDGDCFIIIGGIHDYKDEIDITYWKSTAKSISKGKVLSPDADVTFLDDIEEIDKEERLFFNPDGEIETVPRELFVKRFIQNEIGDSYGYPVSNSLDSIFNIFNMSRKVTITDAEDYDFKIKTDKPLTYYERQRLALYLYTYAETISPTFIMQEL